MTLALQATPQDVMRAVDLLFEFGKERGLAERESFAVALILEECATNIVQHALRSDPHQKFSVTFDHTGAEIILELRDTGPEFDPTRGIETSQQNPQRDGGWGLQLVRRYANTISYRREAGQNILRLTKKLAEAGAPPSLS
jgi:anti-sigma regulatory factor (Ser/Thr protein kinase)